MDRLLLVDGSNLLFQMFFGMPARITNQQGKAIQGTLGFVGALLKIIRMVKPTHVAVLFDGEHENPRKLTDENYKSNRVDYSIIEDNNNPFAQLPDVYAALDYLGIRHAETVDCETDDWIAGYSLTYGENMQIMISSFDSDYFQLINDHVSVLRYRGEKTVVCDTAYIRDKLGIEPFQYADFKALTGDASDNIKGACKVGPKTAAALITEFGSLEAVLEYADQITKPTIRNSIIADRERLRRNHKLIRLDGVSNLPFLMEELNWHDNSLTTVQVLSGIGLR